MHLGPATVLCTFKMADFEGNPFADPEGVNPFAVSLDLFFKKLV